MIFLILSILFNTGLFLIFKHIGKLKADLLTAIISNYLVCIALGYALSPADSFQAYSTPLKLIHIGLGFLFFSIFYLMGKSSAINGVGITSTAGKLSLLLSSSLLAILFDTGFGWMNVLTLAITMLALYWLSYEPEKKAIKGKLWMPILIFVGSGIIDTCLALTKHYQMEASLHPSPSITLIFTGACTLALFVFLTRIKTFRLDIKGIVYGIVLGLVNYLSIHFLFEAIGERADLSLNNLMIINNTGVVLLSFISAIAFYGEPLYKRQLMGILLAMTAILMTLRF